MIKETKTKKRYLISRVRILALALLAYAFALLIMLMRAAYEPPQDVSALFPVFVVLPLGAIISCAVIFVVIPYERLCRIQQMFVCGQLYDELLRQKIGIAPQNDRVMEYFDSVINKRDVADLSKQQAEYLALQNQINPHFLYNTLEAIRGDALCIGANELAQTTEALSAFFRYTIAESKSLVPIERELESVENYFIIQQYRFGDKLKMEISMDDDPRLRRYLIPKLTLQPIIENAVFHGLENQMHGGTITVRVQMTEKRVLISISDDGVGMKKEDVDAINQRMEKVALNYISEDGQKRRHGNGIALRNVAQRIKLLFGEEYGLSLYSIQGMGTEVRINIPKRLSDSQNGDAPQ